MLCNVKIAVVQATLSASTGYSLQCVEYIVSGSYSVSVRAADGSYSWVTGTATAASVISGGCGPLTSSITIDATTEYSTSYSGDKYILGYRTHYGQSKFLLLPMTSLPTASRGCSWPLSLVVVLLRRSCQSRRTRCSGGAQWPRRWHVCPRTPCVPVARSCWEPAIARLYQRVLCL